MFLAEYDYNEDIAVKKEEAYEDGFDDGFSDGVGYGAEKNKMENARALIIKTHFPMKDIADWLNLSDEQQAVLKKEFELK